MIIVSSTSGTKCFLLVTFFFLRYVFLKEHLLTCTWQWKINNQEIKLKEVWRSEIQQPEQKGVITLNPITVLTQQWPNYYTTEKWKKITISIFSFFSIFHNFSLSSLLFFFYIYHEQQPFYVCYFFYLVVRTTHR